MEDSQAVDFGCADVAELGLAGIRTSTPAHQSPLNLVRPPRPSSTVLAVYSGWRRQWRTGRGRWDPWPPRSLLEVFAIQVGLGRDRRVRSVLRLQAAQVLLRQISKASSSLVVPSSSGGAQTVADQLSS